MSAKRLAFIDKILSCCVSVDESVSDEIYKECLYGEQGCPYRECPCDDCPYDDCEEWEGFRDVFRYKGF